MPDRPSHDINDIHAAAREAKHRYVWALDLRRWDEYAATLADEVEVDFTSLGYAAPMRTSPLGWTGRVRRLMDGLDVSFHSVTNLIAEPDGDEIVARCYVTAQHVLRAEGRADRTYEIGGVYQDRLRRLDGRWRFTRIVFQRMWAVGDPSVMTEGAARAGRRRD